jgi:2-desacetyl-2-hydroxyethyl bacteriochlorophyllide A dehydrogenase
MKNLAVYFTGVKKVEVREEKIPVIGEQEVLVRALSSVISSGTEMLFYYGFVSAEAPMDEKIPLLTRHAEYPFKHGYAVVGKVIGRGEKVDPIWNDRLVFAFHPHESFFSAKPGDLIVIDNLEVEDAVFTANMETAVNLIMDGRPVIGENVVVFGQGVVGLLTTSLLAMIPIRRLVTIEIHEKRRAMSIGSGAHASLDPGKLDVSEPTDHLFGGEKADLVYEITGNSEALEKAIQLTGFGGRVIIGSWYGTEKRKVKLSSHFHRHRIKLISSQVSTLAPEFTGSWTKQRRLDITQEMIHRIRPSRLITHRIPVQEANKAYRLLEQKPDETVGVILTY